MNKYYAHINSYRVLTGVDLSQIIKDEYDSEDVLNIEVSEDVYNNQEKYIYVDGELIFDEGWEEKEKQKEREQFLKDFFNTSLGYVRRQVSMQTGDTKDFLTDILPLLQVGIPILTYTEDGEQHKVMVTEDFINECKQQLLKDFYGV